MVELELLGVSIPEEDQFPVVLLRHESKVLPIVVGSAEAEAIHSGLLGEKKARPMTHDLVVNLLAGLRAKLKSVNIYRLENDTFYAHLNLEQRNSEGQVENLLRIDTRPSDGIAIAVRLGCPIFAAQEVMNAAAQDDSVLSPGDDHDDHDDDDEYEEGS